jgi:hypothetical protein
MDIVVDTYPVLLKPAEKIIPSQRDATGAVFFELRQF